MQILFQSSDLIVCVKPVGVTSQGEAQNAMPQMLSQQLGGQVYPVHRLDTQTGGVMVYARTNRSAASLSECIRQGSLHKEYLAVIEGIPAEDTGTLKDLLFHDRMKNKTYVVARKRAGVKEAILDYHVLQSVQSDGKSYSLVHVLLHTGRTHQIRVQFSSRGLPLLGDGKYGSKDNRCTAALWAYRLRFPLKDVQESFFCPPPDAFPWTLFDRELISCI